MRKLTTQEWVEKAKVVHGDKFDYSLAEYNGCKNKVKIICPNNHVFEQSPDGHLGGRGCLKCKGMNKSTDDIISEFNTIHNKKYSYELVEYNGSNTKVTIKCQQHGYFKQTPSSHLSGNGCPKCAIYLCSQKRTLSKNDFIKKIKIIHNNKYDYSFINNYKNLNSYLNIKCGFHGFFTQKAGKHLMGQGCPKCARIRIQKSSKENPTGWSATNWGYKAKDSVHFDSFKVYIIRCWNDEEEFYKIGRTYVNLYKRFSGKRMPYNYEVVHKIIFDNSRDCFNKETELKRIHKKYKYLPKIKFGGMYECFRCLNCTLMDIQPV